MSVATQVHTWVKVRRQFSGGVFFFHLGGPKEQTLVVRLGSKYLYLLNHFVGPKHHPFWGCTFYVLVTSPSTFTKPVKSLLGFSSYCLICCFLKLFFLHIICWQGYIPRSYLKTKLGLSFCHWCLLHLWQFLVCIRCLKNCEQESSEFLSYKGKDLNWSRFPGSHRRGGIARLWVFWYGLIVPWLLNYSVCSVHTFEILRQVGLGLCP